MKSFDLACLELKRLIFSLDHLKALLQLKLKESVFVGRSIAKSNLTILVCHTQAAVKCVCCAVLVLAVKSRSWLRSTVSTWTSLCHSLLVVRRWFDSLWSWRHREPFIK